MPVMKKIKAITDPRCIIPFPDIGDQLLLDVLKRCLQRDPRLRPTIPGKEPDSKKLNFRIASASFSTSFEEFYCGYEPSVIFLYNRNKYSSRLVFLNRQFSRFHSQSEMLEELIGGALLSAGFYFMGKVLPLSSPEQLDESERKLFSSKSCFPFIF